MGDGLALRRTDSRAAERLLGRVVTHDRGIVNASSGITTRTSNGFQPAQRGHDHSTTAGETDRGRLPQPIMVANPPPLLRGSGRR